ncbi:MAG TPA: hydantoinase B/oxoprolinase family protein [Solirubrobacteraceae bacterium]|nr:hydantoinase B/oxoprolinase family protein [Solirubrobacteraceae bacterium]
MKLDPVTFEVIRHRLWAINDDQAMIAARLSGSPVVYEAYDFNAALMTADGRGLYSGIYIIHHASTIDIFVRRILEEWPAEEIREGDMFFTNDPWWGALHANDGILATPIFWDGRIVSWSGIVMHDNDVGSPVPGSFVVGSHDRFGEAPLFPGIKLVERMELRRDIERAYLRNHRTPEMNALNLRARLASLRITHRRIHELIERYGLDTFLAAQDEIVDYVERVVRARLREMPDGSWSEQIYHDHDGNDAVLYPMRCRLTKRGDSLTVDLTGTAKQAPGAINCARPAMEGAVLGVFLTFLCYDLPWAVAAGRRIVEIVSEEGTLNNAVSPAGVSMASIMGTLSTQDVVAAAFAKMLMASDRYRGEAQAVWSPGINCPVMAGVDRNGEPFTSVFLDCSGGGGGARSYTDGVDSGGILHSMSASIPNVETNESRSAVLQVYRRECCDSSGPGRFRGGVGIEIGMLPHKNRGAIASVTLASGVSQPEGHGLSGGGAAPVKSNIVLRSSNARALFAGGKVPVAAAELEQREVDVLAAKDHTLLADDDFIVVLIPGGGGYGDPLRREPDAVAADVAAGLVSEAVAGRVYGVVLEDGAVDAAATLAARDEIRAERLRDGRAGAGSNGAAADPGAAAEQMVCDTVELAGDALRCSVCHHVFGDRATDYKLASSMRELPITYSSPLNALGLVDEIVLREFSCPGCGTAVAVDVQRREEPLLAESSLAPAART